MNKALFSKLIGSLNVLTPGDDSFTNYMGGNDNPCENNYII
jgi:hypothetical protein